MKSLSLYTAINTNATVLQQNAAIYDNALKQDKKKSHLQIWIHYSNNTIIYFVMAKDNKKSFSHFFMN